MPMISPFFIRLGALVAVGLCLAGCSQSYTPHNAHELVGISRSTVFRIVNGSSRMLKVVEKLLDMYARYVVPGDKR